MREGAPISYQPRPEATFTPGKVHAELVALCAEAAAVQVNLLLLFFITLEPRVE